MEKLLKSKRFHIGVAVVLAISILIVYSNTFNASFHFDDTHVIVENHTIRDLGNLGEIVTGPRGITIASFAINYAIGGLDVTSYHVVNILIHIIVSILAYIVVFNTLQMTTKNDEWSKKIAAFSALLFALHPVQTQAVTYIVQRMESLSSLFYLAGIAIFIAAVRSPKQTNRIALYAAIVAVFLLGFYSKEIAITMPAVIFIYDFFFVSGGSFKPLTGRWPLYAVMALLMITLTAATIIPSGGFNDLTQEASGIVAAEAKPSAGARAPSAGFGVKSITPTEYLYTQFNVIVYYIALLAVPVNQNLDYDFPISRSLFAVPQVNEGTVLNIPIPPPVISLLILLTIAGLGVYLFIKSRAREDKRGLVVSFFIFWFFIVLAPTSSIIPIIDVIFEHRVYLASLGFFVIFAIYFDWFFQWMEERKRQKA